MLKPEVCPYANLHNSLKIGQIKMICTNYNNPYYRSIQLVLSKTPHLFNAFVYCNKGMCNLSH